MWLGCTDEPPPEVTSETEPATSDTGSSTLEGYCGDVGAFDMAFGGFVEDSSGQRMGGVLITLEERNWAQQSFTQALSDPDGRFELSASDLPVIEDCWGHAVSFWLVGSTDTLWGDKPLNANIIEALDAGAESIELAFPLILRE